MKDGFDVWNSVSCDDGTAQVYPVGDYRDHDTVGGGARCWCHPYWDEHILVHVSMDGREKHEAGAPMH